MGLYRAVPTVSAEIAAWRRGHRVVAGIDEAGRGPLAGPVVAGAVVLDPERPRAWWADLRDSKLLTAQERGRLAEAIRGDCACAIGVASHRQIDDDGLVAATQAAMRRAVAALPRRPDMLLIDAVSLPEYRHRAIIHGDALVASIAAGSILAKVARDAIMERYHEEFPAYGFEQNKGYATAEHRRALDAHGPCAIHRRRFEPVRLAEEERRAAAAAVA